MTMKELIETVSTKSKVEEKLVKRVLTTAIDTLKHDISKEDKVKVQGLGTFVRRTSKKDPSKSRISFKPATAKDPEKAKARKAAKAQTVAS
jgi:nucleoid DNA-binding protein